MGLDEYLTNHGLSLRAFARQANLSVSTVLRAKNGTVIGNRRTLSAIVAATNGQVGVADLIRVDDGIARVQAEADAVHDDGNTKAKD